MPRGTPFGWGELHFAFPIDGVNASIESGWLASGAGRALVIAGEAQRTECWDTNFRVTDACVTL